MTDKENILKKIENAIGQGNTSEQETWLRIKQLCTGELQSTLLNTPPKNLTQLTEEFFAGKKLRNMSTGFPSLDKATGGFCEGELVVVGGRPAMGKSLFLLHIGLNMSKQYPVMYLSYDLSDYLLFSRIISIMSGVPPFRTVQNQLTAEEKNRLELAQKELSNYRLTINAEACNSIDMLVEYCIQQIANQGVKVIILDFLQMLNYKHLRRYNRDAEIDEICKRLRDLAKEYKVCIITASSLNRGVEGRTGLDGKRPQLSDLRDSGSIEQMADKVLLLHRPEYYGIIEDCNGNSLRGLLEVIVAKNVAGITGDVRLMFRSELGKIEDISSDFIDKIRSVGADFKEMPPF